jgi:hypothetical protein
MYEEKIRKYNYEMNKFRNTQKEVTIEYCTMYSYMYCTVLYVHLHESTIRVLIVQLRTIVIVIGA